ncbi:uncharacterized protein DEA37_0006986 [Paragonimus westermani]|uniref:Uncharacterized protein n=1 Tax=Paragonimus westermani TaxID=34504 RepID=A0A5J4NYY4_9TREM|nr:uncharacterized protein DEA37_0006986 [Paragonimus westermani]
MTIKYSLDKDHIRWRIRLRIHHIGRKHSLLPLGSHRAVRVQRDALHQHRIDYRAHRFGYSERCPVTEIVCLYVSAYCICLSVCVSIYLPICRSVGIDSPFARRPSSPTVPLSSIRPDWSNPFSGSHVHSHENTRVLNSTESGPAGEWHLIWYSVHPDYVFLLYFARSHITVTVNMILIFGPKAWSVYRPSSTTAGASRTRATPTAPYSADPNLASSGKLNLTLNGDLDIADVNLADMDPEVIRRELKRLYTQIEMYKTKAMRKDNPHISKRRGGRKQRRQTPSGLSFGVSGIVRIKSRISRIFNIQSTVLLRINVQSNTNRFSLQPFHKRHQGQAVPGNVPLMIPTESGYCWADCRSSRGGGSSIGSSGACPKHGVKHTESCTLGNPTCSISGSRAGSYYAYSGIVHDEEVSKLSEESTNSVEEFTPPSNAQQPQHHQLLSTTASAQQGKRRLLSSGRPNALTEQTTTSTSEKA